VDDVDFALRRHRLHAAHVLETQELPDESGLLGRVHGVGGI